MASPSFGSEGQSLWNPDDILQVINDSQREWIIQQASELEVAKSLEENCKRQSLMFHGTTPADGNCFYHAVSDQLNLLSLSPQSVDDLRQSIVSFMRRNPTLQGPDGTIDFTSLHPNWESYCDKMSKDGEWADHVILVATAHMLQRNIMVVTSSPQSTGDQTVCWIRCGDICTEQPLRLGHLYEWHYQSLQTISHYPGTGVREEENFVRLHLALQLICSVALPCINSVIDAWHSGQKITLQKCCNPQQCLSKGKPKLRKSCTSCLDWGHAIETVYYPQSSLHRIPWNNINPTLLNDNIIEVVKAFVLRLPVDKTYTALGDFDAASILMIMMHFNEFHKGDAIIYEAISKAANIRNTLSHVNVNENLRFDQKETGDNFEDLHKLVQYLQGLYPMQFTQEVTRDLFTNLNNLQTDSLMAPFSDKVSLQEAIRNLRDELKKIKMCTEQKCTDWKQELLELLKCPVKSDPEAFDVLQCRRELKRHYLQSLCKIPQFPGDKRNCLNMEDIYTNLSILIDLPKPCSPIQVPLQSHHELFTRKTDNGIPPTRILVLGNPGCGKSILTAKLAHDWAVKNPDSPLKNASFLFALNMRWMTPDTTLEDSILQQLLPRDTTITRESLRNHIERNQSTCIIVFDSYDEYGFSGDFRQQESGVHRILLNECLRDCQVMVTTRFWKAGDFDDLQNVYTQMQISGFSETHVKEYILKFFRHDVVAGERLLTYLIDHNLNPGMANIPLMILLFCLYWKESGGQNMPNKIGDLYSKIIKLLHKQYIGKQKTEKQKTESVNLSRLILETGKVALSGLWSLEEKLVFQLKHFVEMSSHQTLIDGCRIGLLSLEQRSTEPVDMLGTDEDTQQKISSEISNVTNKSVTFFHKSCQEKCAGEFLANLAEADLSNFMSRLKYLDSARSCMRLEMVLRFACGASDEAANFILQRLVQIFCSEFYEQIDQYYQENLDLEQTRNIQKFIELCLLCFYEGPANIKSHLLTKLFPQGQVLFIGMSPYTSSAIGKYIASAKTIKSIVMKAIPSPSDGGVIITGSIERTWTIIQSNMKSLPTKKLQLLYQHQKTYTKENDYYNLCKVELDNYFKDWQSSHGINLVPIFTSLASCDELHTLRLVNVQLGTQMSKLLSVIEQGVLITLTRLDLYNCGLNNEQMGCLLKSIPYKLPRLVWLDISHNKARLTHLGDCLVNSQVQNLFVEGMGAPTEDMSGVISKLLMFGSRMITLHMDRNDIDDNTEKALVNALPCACQLEEFAISMHMMQRNTHNQVIKAMHHLTHLTSLYIMQSPYPDDLLKCISHAMGSLPQLQILALSASTQRVGQQTNQSTLEWLLPWLYRRGNKQTTGGHTQHASQSACQQFIKRLDTMEKVKDLRIYDICLHKEDLISLLTLCKNHDYHQLCYSRHFFPEEEDASQYEFLLFV